MDMRGGRQDPGALRAGLLLTVSMLVGGCADDAPAGERSTSAASIMDGGAREGAPASSEPEVLGFTPTWHEHIAPLVSQKCSACHAREGIAPFSLQSYEAAKPFALAMASAVESGTMPPFLAQETAECKPQNPFARDVRLSAREKAMVRAWANAGAPEGDMAKAVPLPPPPSVSLAREDIVMPLPEPIVVEKGARDIHTCVVVDPKLAGDVYIAGRQITPGNGKVLHHAVLHMLKPETLDGRPLTRAQMVEALMTHKGVGIGGRYECFGGVGLEATGIASENLGAWAPGAAPTISPPSSGQPMKKDALVIMDLHYHPMETREEDRTTKLSLMLNDARPQYIVQPVLLGNFPGRVERPAGIGDLIKQPDEQVAEFRIPAGAASHVEEMTWTWTLPRSPNGIRAYYAGTHMHYVGRNMRVTLENNTPAPGESPRECLVETPRWDFNWQGGYGYFAPYEQLPLMNPGDVLRMRCVYDNTRGNPYLARALDERGLTDPIDVRLGEDTLDEMCLAAIGLIYPNYLP